MIIKSNSKDYEVHLQKDFYFTRQFQEEKNTFFVIDRKVYELYKEELFYDIVEEKLLLIDAVEENKSIETALNICERMTDIPGKRNAHLISIGGGITQDITGFAANILYRGVRWSFVPTTLLAACDSCIGGKTSLNYKNYKNLLGTFYAPDHIYICSQFFQTLSERDYESGLGEVVKFNILYGEDGLKRIEENIDLLLERNEEVLDIFLSSSLDFKKRFIEEDEFDRGERIKLNFAHTFGHAFESVSNYEIPHGTAVGMGTIVANRISYARGLMDAQTMGRIETVLCKIIHIDMDIRKFNMDQMMNAIRKDKKQVDANITAVLFNNNKDLELYHDLTRQEIEDAICNIGDLLEKSEVEGK